MEINGKKVELVARKVHVVTPPGEVVGMFLEKLGKTPKDLASDTGMDEGLVCDLIDGTIPVTPDVAKHLEEYFKIPSELWLSMYRDYLETLS